MSSALSFTMARAFIRDHVLLLLWAAGLLALMLPDMACAAHKLAATKGRESWLVHWDTSNAHVAERLTAAVCSGSDLHALDIKCTASFTALLHGFSAHFGPGALDAFMARHKSAVKYVERDVAYTLGDELLDLKRLHGREPGRRGLGEQLDAPWGLDMIDQHAQPLDHEYHFTRYGTGVHVYVLDTGILSTHEQFRAMDGGASSGTARMSRVTPGFSAFSNPTTEDCHGHGTHVSAIVGGLTYGAAKNVTLVPVQVLDCAGAATATSIVAGLDWVAAHLQTPAVIHMSIEGPYSQVVNDCVEALLATSGAAVVVAAGNSGEDACGVSPASVPSVVTVAAVGADRSRWPRSNWGACVDIHAPGVNITSAVIGSDTAIALKTGTSMAAPFVSGVVALYLQAHPGASADEIMARLFDASTYGAVSDSSAVEQAMTPNRLLYATLQSQATLSPPVLRTDASNAQQQHTVSVQLTRAAMAPVTAAITSPRSWDGQPLAAVEPTALQRLEAGPKSFKVTASSAAVGGFFIQLTLSSHDQFFDGAVHTLKVTDDRPLTGATPSNARLIPTALPFTDSGSTLVFPPDPDFLSASWAAGLTDAERSGAMAPSPAVWYRYQATGGLPEHVTVSSCGSAIDTVLALLEAALDGPLRLLEINDDDPGCAVSKSASRVDATLDPGVAYLILLKGYGDGAGAFKLTVTTAAAATSSA